VLLAVVPEITFIGYGKYGVVVESIAPFVWETGSVKRLQVLKRGHPEN